MNTRALAFGDALRIELHMSEPWGKTLLLTSSLEEEQKEMNDREKLEKFTESTGRTPRCYTLVEMNDRGEFEKFTERAKKA